MAVQLRGKVDRILFRHEGKQHTFPLGPVSEREALAKLLTHVQEPARHPWVYPLVCMAAHTGARRSELIRASVADVDFEGGVVTIHEKQRLKGKRSTRSAPLTPALAGALKAWLALHPGGKPLFCHAGEVARSRNRRATTGHSAKSSGPRNLDHQLSYP